MEGLATVKCFFVKPGRYKEEIVLTTFPMSSVRHSGGVWRSGFCSLCFSRRHGVILALEWGPVCVRVFLPHTSLSYY